MNKSSFIDFLKKKKVEEMDPETRQMHLEGLEGVKERKAEQRAEKRRAKAMKNRLQEEREMASWRQGDDGRAAVEIMSGEKPCKSKKRFLSLEYISSTYLT